MWIVQVALRRPYTFIVLAILVVLLGGFAIVRTPTDIFPAIRIPVVAVVWRYSGLPPTEMASRMVSFSERIASTTENDIEHTESLSLNGTGVVKYFFQPKVDEAMAVAQTTSISQTILSQSPPGTTPPFILAYDASSVPIVQLALSSPTIPESTIFDLGNSNNHTQHTSKTKTTQPKPKRRHNRQVQ